MGNYRRSTRLCSVEQLKPELLKATREYFRSHELGELDKVVVKCCETTSEKQPGGWLNSWLDAGADSTVQTWIILTETSLVWGRTGNRTGVHVVGAELKNIRARVRVSLFSKELGLEIIGLVENAKVNIQGMIGLGPEESAQEFCDEVCQVIEKITPSPKRKWPGWMGGNN